MIKKVTDYVKKYQMISPHDTITAGISGGADSVCLLFMLLEIQKQIPFTLRVVHVNHKVRKEAGQDAEFVRKLCGKFQIPFYLVERNIRELAEEWGCSEEEAGRKVRYQAFNEVQGEDAGKIAVAHNSNDRAETMLFHLFRGTGLSGAAGIRPVNGRIIRPLLGVTREEIEKWLSDKGIAYCMDRTNEQDMMLRNICAGKHKRQQVAVYVRIERKMRFELILMPLNRRTNISGEGFCSLVLRKQPDRERISPQPISGRWKGCFGHPAARKSIFRIRLRFIRNTIWELYGKNGLLCLLRNGGFAKIVYWQDLQKRETGKNER